jgi:nucleoside-diphosphate-sugar epimerase
MILVTGATGFIGRHLVQRLLDEKYQVRCLIAPGEAANLPWENPPEIIEGHVLDDEVLFKAVTNVHVIIHLASAQ